ncbi:Alkaline ceramidase domain protein [Cyclobacterium qasimii]|uniref:Alkaline ceramidase domain protein n=2 Tax=Cyclobacterium qasimii TaxID=1350429 RepID=S7VQ24_9BACT|nr:Alkaline ceramidase domain protein [Cyclobacterium qasimii]EPR71462.1 Alkaline ceramidase domain protein [Cyclobacterium qasimii M12-11B]GEO23647.1 hypothetical protein CQA01_41810 [Cyclobacterium qasimii]
MLKNTFVDLSSRRKFLKQTTILSAGLGLSISTAEAGTAIQNPNASEAPVKAAFADGDISPEIGMESPGNYGKNYHKTFHDPCKVRVSAFQSGARKALIIGFDALAVYQPWVDEIKEGIAAKYDISKEEIMISASHSHSSGPTAMVMPGQYDHASSFVQDLAYKQSSCADPKYLATTKETTVKTALQALEDLEEVEIGVGSGKEEKVAFNRRFFMKNGMTYSHPGQLNPAISKVAGPIDPEVGVIGTWNKAGKCIGCIVNFACHSTTNPGGISANWVYYMEQTIKGALGKDCVVVFLQGASGDVTQVNNRNPNKNRSGEDWARFVGASVGAEAVKTLLSIPRGTTFPITTSREFITIKRRMPSEEKVKESLAMIKKSPEEVGKTDWVFAKETVMLDSYGKRNPTHKVEIQAIQLGPVVLVSNPAEFFCELGLKIKAESQFPLTFPVSMANDCVGYVPTLEAFSINGGGYETRLTSYSNLEITAGNQIVDQSLRLIKPLKPGLLPEFQKAPAFTGEPWNYGNVPPEIR